MEGSLIGKCERDSCLGCRKLKNCEELRAQYERKKSKIQNKRYEQAEAEAAQIETKEFTIPQLAQIAYSLRTQFQKEDGRINVKRMRYVLRKKLKLHISVGRGYDIKEWLVNEYPDDFLGSDEV